MSKKEIIVCDQCGKSGEPFAFAIDEKSFYLDLCRQCYKSLVQPLENLGDKINRKTVVSGSTTRSKASKALSKAPKRAYSGSGRSKEELQAIRDWAKSNKIKVPPRGRIKAEIIQKYDEVKKS